ncbi:MAG: META domain-containing protein [Muribaculaceae bacterium]|nr:META domain-containing protein [Muribaculaceae bacterium]
MSRITLIAAAISLSILATGCGTIQNATNKVTQKAKSFIVKGDKAEKVTPPEATAEKLAQEARQDYTTVLPQPDVDVTPASPVPAYTPPADTASEIPAADRSVESAVAPTPDTPLARNLGGEWQIVLVGTNEIDRDEDMPYIVFDPSASSFYANNGCNTLNGMYTLDGKDDITFHNVLSTMRLCPDTTFDNEINVIISDNATTHLRMSDVGKETFIDFLTEGGKTLMRMRRGNLDFLNGNWDVVSIAGISEMQVPADIFFDLGELKLHGNTGCNYINGNIYLDHRRSNAVDFSNMITTRMACPYNDQQTAMLVALEQTESAISDGADRVMFLDANGRNVMTLKRAANQNPEE